MSGTNLQQCLVHLRERERLEAKDKLGKFDGFITDFQHLSSAERRVEKKGAMAGDEGVLTETSPGIFGLEHHVRVCLVFGVCLCLYLCLCLWLCLCVCLCLGS